MRALCLVGLFVIGCGSGSAPAPSDLATPVADMAAPKSTCSQLVQCSAACAGNLSCQSMCAANASPTAIEKFGSFAACLVVACGPAGDGGTGGVGSCAIPPDNTQKCQSCIVNTGLQAALDAHAACHAEYVACQTS